MRCLSCSFGEAVTDTDRCPSCTSRLARHTPRPEPTDLDRARSEINTRIWVLGNQERHAAEAHRAFPAVEHHARQLEQVRADLEAALAELATLDGSAVPA